MTLDEMIQESISTGKPLEFSREDLKDSRFKLISWTSIEVESQINKLSERWYVPAWGIAMAHTTHWLVYSILMEDLYFNYHPNEKSTEEETQVDNESDWEVNLRNTNREWWPIITWGAEEDDWLEPVMA